jgi:hypothetical protein
MGGLSWDWCFDNPSLGKTPVRFKRPKHAMPPSDGDRPAARRTDMIFEILQVPTAEPTSCKLGAPGRHLQNFKYLWLGFCLPFFLPWREPFL